MKVDSIGKLTHTSQQRELNFECQFCKWCKYLWECLL